MSSHKPAEVWVTGLGLITPLGNGVAETWTPLLAGQSGAGPITRFDASWLAVQIAAEVQGFNTHAPQELASALCLSAAVEALRDAALPVGGAAVADMDWIVGTSRGEFLGLEQSSHHQWARGQDEDPGLAAAFLTDNASYGLLDRIADQLGQTGRRTLISNACASGGYAIGQGVTRIRQGLATQVLCGGVDVLSEVYHSFFCGIRSLTATACRPFDAQRDGLLLGEGAAVLLLETADEARRRNVKAWARVAGTGWSCDAYHLAIPDPSGDGVALALRRALAESQLSPENITGVVAHGTGTVSNDLAEARAIKRVLGKKPVTAPKSMLGHAMGASGAIESVIAILALHHRVLPPTLGHEQTDPACPVICSNQPQPMTGTALLANAAGFGGNNACLIFDRAGEGPWRDA